MTFRTTRQLREIWGPECLSMSDRSTVTLDGRNYVVHKDTVPAWEAWERIRSKHGYSLDSSQTGTYNCRQITGGSGYSLHSFGIALDVNWLRNGYGDRFVSDIPSGMTREILDLRAGSHRLFKWGGDWDDDAGTPHSKYDAMHFEINATAGEIRAGITGEPEEEEEDVMTPEQETKILGAIANSAWRIEQLTAKVDHLQKEHDKVKREVVRGSYGRWTPAAGRTNSDGSPR